MTKQSYFWATPSGPINLIEGDKMPPEPIQTNAWNGKDYRENAFNNSQKFHYAQALQAAKGSSVPIQDHERATRIIQESIGGNGKGPNAINPYGIIVPADRIYGPFNITYELQPTCDPGVCNSWETCYQNKRCMAQVAILYDDTPEKEESQETLLDELVTDIFEIGKEAILEKFTITRKQ